MAENVKRTSGRGDILCRPVPPESRATYLKHVTPERKANVRRNAPLRIAAFVALTAFGLPLAAVEHAPQPDALAAKEKAQTVGGKEYSPNVGQTYPDRVLWGLTRA